MIRRVVLFLSLALAASAALCQAADVGNPVVLVFYREGCEDCDRMMPTITDLEAKYPDLGFRYIEDKDPDASLLWSLAAAYAFVPVQFPVILVGKRAIVGASLANELLLRSAVQVCAQSKCPSPLDVLHPSGIPWMTLLLVGLAALVVVIAFLV